MAREANGVVSGRMLVHSLVVAAVGGLVGVVAMSMTPRADAQPAQWVADSSGVPDILGKTVIIQFNRQVLGMATPSVPGWSETREGSISVQGDVIALRGGWVGIRGADSKGERRDIWVPTHAIMSIITR